MLHYQSLPLHLWVEACNTAVYLQNRNPHRILGMKTHMEAFSGKRPDVSHFQIFGSSVYCHVTKDAWKKLDPIAELGILVGYTDTPHNYQVYLPSTQRTMVHRDLKFDEQKAMCLSLERELNLHAYEELSAPKDEEIVSPLIFFLLTIFPFINHEHLPLFHLSYTPSSCTSPRTMTYFA